MTKKTKENKVLNLYPIDYPFETLIGRVENKKLRLNPDFQRKYKWDKDGNTRGSRFIESCLMRIPLPACYFAEQEDSTHEVIDGVQRITTIQKFFNGDFALENLTVFKELEGKKFNDLGDLKNELESTTIRCVVLRKENPKGLVNEIFARLNQGAVKLENQEIRHAVYPGTLDRLLEELGNHEIIMNFKGTKNDSREKEEIVLRYFALQSDLSDYDGNFTKYLDNYMEKNQNLSSEQIEALKKDFNSTLEKCLIAFNSDDIFIDTSSEQPKQGLVYYDLLMWFFKNLPLEQVLKYKDEIKEKFKSLFSSPEFIKTKTGGLQKKSSILKRRELCQKELSSIVHE